MGRKKCICECEKCLPMWLAAFGDLMSLLLCFFVLLLSMSTMDAKKVSDAVGSLSGALSVLEGGIKTEVSQSRMRQTTEVETTEETSNTIQRVAKAAIEANEITKQGGGPSITVEEAEEGYVIRLPASLLFKPGSAVIENEDTLLFLKRIAMIITQIPNEVDVSVRGHSDDQPPGKNSLYKDNWELSSARAISVLHELLVDGVSPERIGVAGFAQFRPITTNATEDGRAKNRRVEIYFTGRKNIDTKAAKQSILDEGIEVSE